MASWFFDDLLSPPCYGTCSSCDRSYPTSSILVHRYAKVSLSVEEICIAMAKQEPAIFSMHVFRTHPRLRRAQARLAKPICSLKRAIRSLALNGTVAAVGHNVKSSRRAISRTGCSPQWSTSSYPDAVADCIRFMKTSAGLAN
ncbi:hypothetical protein KP509_06G084200 [Ceratopteris richardii]|uniref:Uncharacterized protein n=1 Tax=Ceratopteris richardii TaxID=49495 RepID=A0A8T2URC6_CERRI|nr:hypothetical protein KP509_06G084200 [Ceratopteris richardii]